MGKECATLRGHIAKKGDKYYVVVYLGIGADGKRKYKWHSGYAKKKDAEKAMPTILHQMNTGAYVETTEEKLSDYMQRWLEYKSQHVLATSMRTYEAIVRRYVTPSLGRLKLVDLKPYHLSKFYGELQKTLSARYVAQIHSVMHDALDRALKWEIVARNVADVVDAPSPKKMKFTVWSREQANRFITHPTVMRHRFYVVFLLALTTGMRQSEITGLRWRNIDLENGIIHVVEQQVYNKGTTDWGPVKSESGVRDIAIPEQVVTALRKHKARQNQDRLMMQKAWIDRDLVVTRINGNWVSAAFLRMHWKHLVEIADVPYIRFHDLRHTHASMLLEMGEELKVIQEQLGHATIGITADTYAHVAPSLKRGTAKKISEGLFGDRD